MEYVKEHLTDPDLSLKDLGDRFNLSVSAVSKLFKRVCGINFYDFLLSGRMELACEMLENKKITLAAAARAVGYEN
ncbi:MAG: helix-turn-helix domain-containing protein, partial [Ruthenibacterium lactatiformans]